jgi:hypothetical protein
VIERARRDGHRARHVHGWRPTLHRQFGDILVTVAELSLACSFVTNGWHFERVAM